MWIISSQLTYKRKGQVFDKSAVQKKIENDQARAGILQICSPEMCIQTKHIHRKGAQNQKSYKLYNFPSCSTTLYAKPIYLTDRRRVNAYCLAYCLFAFPLDTQHFNYTPRRNLHLFDIILSAEHVRENNSALLRREYYDKARRPI